MGTSAPAAAPPAAPASQGAGSTPSQPASAPGQGQGGFPGTGGQSQGAGNEGFNWGLFPNVPEAQRELLQPHLTNVMGHVTRLEQQMSPYRGLMESVPAGDAEGLQTFLTNYNNDPIGTWLGMAQALAENGQISAPGFSVEALQALVSGQQPGVASQMPGPVAPGGEEIPAWAQELMSKVDRFDQAEQTRQQQAEAQQNEQILGEAHAGMREQLTAAGIAPQVLEAITPEQLTASLIVSNGDVQQAVQHMIGLRDQFLGGFVQQNGQGPQQPVINGSLQTPKSGGKKGDSFKQARAGAEQMLKQSAAAGAQ